MTRRYATSAPPSGSSQSSSHRSSSRRHHHHHHHSRRHHDADVEFREKESGFDWAPGIAIALLGTLAYLNRDFDKHVRFDDDAEQNYEEEEEQKRWRKKSSSTSRSGSSASDESMSPPPSQGRKRRGRSQTPKNSDKEQGDREGIEKYYEYGPKPGKPVTCEDCDED